MEDLDRLAAEFAARGCVPDGAEVADDRPAEGPRHGGEEHSAGHGHGASVRRFTHRGHEVEIVTRYEVAIDGERWDRHLGVLEDGTVTYHGLPQYAVPSAVELVRTVIDYEEDTPKELRAAFRAAREAG